MREITWLDLTARYSDKESALMFALKEKGKVTELRLIHELKALLDARLTDAPRIASQTMRSSPSE